MVKRFGFTLGLAAVLPLAASAQQVPQDVNLRVQCLASSVNGLALRVFEARPGEAPQAAGRAGGGRGRATAPAQASGDAPAGAVARSGGARGGGAPAGGQPTGQPAAGAGARGRGAGDPAIADRRVTRQVAPVSWITRGDSFENALFSPEQVLARAEAIQLTDVQRATINNEVARLQSQTVELQQQVAAEQTALRQLLEARPIDDQAAVGQLGRLMELEKQVKNLNFLSMVQIKNTLSEAQVTQLNGLLGRC